MSGAASFVIVDAGADAASQRFQVWRLCAAAAGDGGCALELWCSCARFAVGSARELVRCLPDQAAALRHVSAREDNEAEEGVERALRGAVAGAPGSPGVCSACHALPGNLVPQDVPY